MNTTPRYKDGLPVVDSATFQADPARYELRERDPQAPLCPYGNQRTYIGYDREQQAYVWFTKSVLLHFLKKQNQ